MPVINWNSCYTTERTEELVEMFKIKSKWNERFNMLKLNYIYYKFVFKLRRRTTDLKNSLLVFVFVFMFFLITLFFRSDIDPNSFRSPKEALDFMIDEWVQNLNKSETRVGFFNGQDGPNLADLVRI